VQGDQDQHTQLGTGDNDFDFDDGARHDAQQYVGGAKDRIDLGIGVSVFDSLHAPQYRPGTCAAAKFLRRYIFFLIEEEHIMNPLPEPEVVHLVDRLVRNVKTGRFERSLSGLTAAGALVTAAEIYFEHDKASFGNKWMWLPVALGPVGAAAGVAGVFSRRMAKTALPIASAAIVANGVQGTYLHARGIAQKPGGFSNLRYNLEMGPPLLAPLLVTLVGGMGLLASVLRRER
jgi:hypothetical protein